MVTIETILPLNGWSNQKVLFQPLIRAADPGWSSQKALFQPVIRAEDPGCLCWLLAFVAPYFSLSSPQCCLVARSIVRYLLQHGLFRL